MKPSRLFWIASLALAMTEQVAMPQAHQSAHMLSCQAARRGWPT